MKGPGLQIDERTVGTTRKICTRLYLLTITALWIDVCWRQFVAGQSLSDFADLAALMTVNVFLFIGSVLYCGGVAIPKIRPWAVASFYLICVAAGIAFTYSKYQSSSGKEIIWRLLLVAAIAGIVVLLYVLAAFWSARKSKKQLEE